jgi:hypothetical protein
MVTPSSRRAEQAGEVRAGRIADRRLIRQASAWLPARSPQPARLQDLEESEAIRWVDLYGGNLRDSEAQALLDPVCYGELEPRMVRDLITPAGFPADRSYDGGRIAITAAFRTRHLRRGGGVSSVFEPVHLLVGDGWLLSSWLPPRTYRGLSAEVVDPEQASNELYRAVAEAWSGDGGESATDLAESVQRELALTSGSRPQPV